MEKLSIVIPALNEELRLPSTLKELSVYLGDSIKDYEHEIIVVVPIGTDNTLEIAKEYKKVFDCDYQIVEPGPKLGKGRDVRSGVMSATGDKIIFMDADLATPLHHIPQLLGGLTDKKSMAIGSRNLNAMHTTRLRSLVSRLGNLASKLLVGVYYEDTQCGFKGFTKEAAEIIFNKQTITGWAFDIELLTIAKRNNINISVIPIQDWVDVPGGNITDNVLSSSVNTLRELLKIRFNIIRGKY